MDILNWATSYNRKTAYNGKALMYIDGNWESSKSDSWFGVINPATESEFIQVPNGNSDDCAEAIQAAQNALPNWSNLPGSVRGEYLFSIAAELKKAKRALGRLITLEQGKPLSQSIWEVEYSIQYLRWYAEEASRLNGYIIQSQIPGRRHYVVYNPIGVVGIITPWNLPCAMVIRKMAASLAAGCTIIIKPSELTPATSIALAQFAESVKLPSGVFNVITGNPVAIAEEFFRNYLVRLVSFTGSREVGKNLIRQSSNNNIKLSLQMGGHAPFIVLEDCDLNKVLQDIIINKFRSTGQSCLSANRLYVHESIADIFCEKLLDKIMKLKIGDGLDSETDMGPLINKEAVLKVHDHVTDAVAKGAKLLCGGFLPSKSEYPFGFFYPPTILWNVNRGMKIYNEETFGPVLPVAAFHDEEAVIIEANSSRYGLAAYIYTENWKKGLKIAERLEYGAVGLNEPVPTAPQAPFGGIKESGIGREGGREGLLEFLEPKLITISDS